MSEPCRTWLVSGGEYDVYSLKISAPSEAEAVRLAEERFRASGWDGWKYCGSDSPVLIQGEGEGGS